MKLRNYEELWTTMNYELLSKECDSYEQTTIHTCQRPEVVHSKAESLTSGPLAGSCSEPTQPPRSTPPVDQPSLPDQHPRWTSDHTAEVLVHDK